MNKYLDSVFTQLHEAHRQLLEENKLINSSAIKGKFEVKTDDNMTFFREFLQRIIKCYSIISHWGRMYQNHRENVMYNPATEKEKVEYSLK